ncbi:MAG: metallophosphoesterase [Burkholderiales bacterium]
MEPGIRFLDENPLGSDYVVGDLHGERRLLDVLLERVRFNPAHDRLISVGDLIDRGPDSEACLELLCEPWFYAAFGNHEELFITACGEVLESGAADIAWSNWVFNGGGWFTRRLVRTDNSRMQVDDWALSMIERVKALPLVIVVGRDSAHRFNVVHAELPGWMGDAELDRGAEPLQPKDRDRMVWGRALMHSGDRFPKTRPGLSPTYCGHTPDNVVRFRASHICIDTGAVYPFMDSGYRDSGYGLTLVRPKQRLAWTIHPEDVSVEEFGY